MAHRMDRERRYEIDRIMGNQVFYGGERYDVPEDLYWIWYDIEEMTEIDEIHEAYEQIDEWFKENNIR